MLFFSFLEHFLVIFRPFWTIFGPFHFEKSNEKNVQDLVNLTSSYGLSQFVSGPSHERGHTLDLVFANPHQFDIPLSHRFKYV